MAAKRRERGAHPAGGRPPSCWRAGFGDAAADGGTVGAARRGLPRSTWRTVMTGRCAGTARIGWRSWPVIAVWRRRPGSGWRRRRSTGMRKRAGFSARTGEPVRRAGHRDGAVEGQLGVTAPAPAPGRKRRCLTGAGVGGSGLPARWGTNTLRGHPAAKSVPRPARAEGTTRDGPPEGRNRPAGRQRKMVHRRVDR